MIIITFYIVDIKSSPLDHGAVVDHPDVAVGSSQKHGSDEHQIPRLHTRARTHTVSLINCFESI